jgi:3',5'-cyclic AMP phosphodiesterase CpdA
VPVAVTGRILHISDLHLGHSTVSGPFTALRELVPELAPEILVVTGDLTHRGRRLELERARELLGDIGVPILAIPGNHDIPYSFPGRFTRTRDDWEGVFGTTEPLYVSERLAVVGLSSVRPWRQQGGALESSQLDGVALKLERAQVGALRTVALHHHLAAPPWRAARKRPVRRRDGVLQKFASAGVELVLSGHVHQAAVSERREFEVVERDRRASLVLATAAGFGRPRPQRRGEAVGFNVYESDDSTISVFTWCWTGEGFAEIGKRTFQRGWGAGALASREAETQL